MWADIIEWQKTQEDYDEKDDEGPPLLWKL
jgi:hypothetical protein